MNVKIRKKRASDSKEREKMYEKKNMAQREKINFVLCPFMHKKLIFNKFEVEIHMRGAIYN